MKIELKKDYAIFARTLPEGTQLRVSNALGKELVKKGVAKSFDGYTDEQKVEHIVQIAVDNEELPKVKKVTKKKKRTD